MPDHGFDATILDKIKQLKPESRYEVLEGLGLTPTQLMELLYDWEGVWARPNQIEPPGNWRTWLILAGRGFGKTRSVCEWTRKLVESGRAGRIALVGRTTADVRDVLVEGESGILATAKPTFRPVWQPSKRRITWPNGAIASTYSGDEPDQLRGPQHDGAVADELAAWADPDAWNQLQFGLRLGADPRVAVATTPRPTPLIKTLIKDPTTVVHVGTTYDNMVNLAPAFIDQIIKKYEGTRLGRQELLGRVLDDNPSALWKRAMFNERRRAPDLKKVVVAIDPAVSSNPESDETGIVVAGLGIDNLYYVIADLSLQGTPDEWARIAYYAYREYDADRIVAEVNNGGEMVEAILRGIDPQVPYTAVRASRGKMVRAEPISALYEQHRVYHVKVLEDLENQLCEWSPVDSKDSPDRLDALVWALTWLSEYGIVRRIRAA